MVRVNKMTIVKTEDEIRGNLAYLRQVFSCLKPESAMWDRVGGSISTLKWILGEGNGD